MRGQDEGNAEAESELQRLREGHLERAALPERPDRECVVDRKGAVEREGTEIAGPDLVDALQRTIHQINGDEAEAVIDKVRRHVKEHDEPRCQA